MPKEKRANINVRIDGKGIDVKDWKKHDHAWHCHKEGGAIYGLGFIGAIIYYLSHATGFWDGVLGILKAIVWPAFLVFKLLGI